MAKVTSKLQVTIPKHIADQLGIAPGTEIQFERSGNGLRAAIGSAAAGAATVAERLILFDQATARRRSLRSRKKQHAARGASSKVAGRGWKRDELYERGRAR